MIEFGLICIFIMLVVNTVLDLFCWARVLKASEIIIKVDKERRERIRRQAE